MKSENEEVLNMDDLVFENRNKEYGAYAIRKAYSENIHRALGYALFVTVAAVMLPLVFPSIFPKVPALPKGPTIIWDKPPVIAPPQKARVIPPPAQQRVAANVAPLVTTQIVDDVLPDVPPAEPGTDDGQNVVLASGGDGPATDVPTTPAVVEPPRPVDWAEVMPQYEGMAKYVQKNLHYPAVARRMGIEGAVFVQFVVNTDGRVMDVHVIKGISKECDEEAVRVISGMPAWTAGRQGNVPVMVRMVLPIKFRLSI